MHLHVVAHTQHHHHYIGIARDDKGLQGLLGVIEGITWIKDKVHDILKRDTSKSVAFFHTKFDLCHTRAH